VSDYRELAKQKRAEAEKARRLARGLSVQKDREVLLQYAQAMERAAAELEGLERGLGSTTACLFGLLSGLPDWSLLAGQALY